MKGAFNGEWLLEREPVWFPGRPWCPEGADLRQAAEVCRCSHYRPLGGLWVQTAGSAGRLLRVWRLVGDGWLPDWLSSRREWSSWGKHSLPPGGGLPGAPHQEPNPNASPSLGAGAFYALFILPLETLPQRRAAAIANERREAGTQTNGQWRQCAVRLLGGGARLLASLASLAAESGSRRVRSQRRSRWRRHAADWTPARTGQRGCRLVSCWAGRSGVRPWRDRLRARKSGSCARVWRGGTGSSQEASSLSPVRRGTPFLQASGGEPRPCSVRGSRDFISGPCVGHSWFSLRTRLALVGRASLALPRRVLTRLEEGFLGASSRKTLGVI